jgi:hypothetical protein
MVMAYVSRRSPCQAVSPADCVASVHS